jgi:hypothetical protein
VVSLPTYSSTYVNVAAQDGWTALNRVRKALPRSRVGEDNADAREESRNEGGCKYL